MQKYVRKAYSYKQNIIISGNTNDTLRNNVVKATGTSNVPRTNSLKYQRTEIDTVISALHKHTIFLTTVNISHQY